MAARIVAVIAGVCCAAVALLFGVRHFLPSNTRLTKLPAPVASAIAAIKMPAAPKHVIVVVEENKEFSQIAGDVKHAPYLNALIAKGALFTKSYGVAHPSQPNYLALFAGITDTNGDHCPPAGIDTSAQNLATELARKGKTFGGYSEDLPAPGSRVCSSGEYARKHVPWADFENVPAKENQPFSALPRYDRLPTVSFIIPNLQHDMHSASIARGDAWLQQHLGPLVDWAMKNDALVIVTWDESDDTVDNHIPTIFAGPMVKPGRYSEPISHYNVLRTIEDFYGLAHAGAAEQATPITQVWK